MNDQRVYRCTCRDLAHSLALWSDPAETDDIDVSMVVPWMPWRWRLAQAWRVIRGNPGTAAFVCLSPDDAVALANDLAERAQALKERRA